MTVATVMVPTTGDRGLLLPLSVGSIQAQSVHDIEIFIMGDGVDEATRAVIRTMAAADPRIRFFDHPKDARRGEPNRHAALAEARGEIVCYATDRDLMLPHHVAVMTDLLRGADFAHTLRYGIAPDGEVFFHHQIDINHPADRAAIASSPHLVPLGFAGHTLAMYRRLPHGWRTTPEGRPTDRYMWEQFLEQEACRTASSTWPTILYFNRTAPPAWSTPRRREELERYHAKLADPAWVAAWVDRVRDAAIRDRSRLARDAEARVRAIEAAAAADRKKAAGKIEAVERRARALHGVRRRFEHWRAGLRPRVRALRERFDAHRERLRRYRATEPARSTQPNVGDLAVMAIPGGLRLEVYWLGPPAGPGPSASVYAGDDEVMRLDCFGGGRGHMHLNMKQARLAPGGGAARLAFGPGDVEDDIDRAAFELRTNLGYALKLNRRARVRAMAPHPKDLAAAAEWMRAGLLGLVEKHGA